ncbi:Agmatinase [Thermococcus kodakarensis KOD1]|uniref:N(1)-aminopropylagmatine ureohydrolase n=1 Tax=Thermococcus kodakarensis (strain ATCC BAA-918 / JCM 12380 / KOD1) TaxID=69014 RepID=APAUH_THEKO|nr:agmatinase [Thermococcus kodakarensis]Q5JI38.1 RecName: Full=N(1)-aminopropylagmatine ureohydrolase; AltName: Full=Agmatinase; AltName: Full=Protein SpeB homolog [Thermococcus kodakarensis KOD1]WCN28876.1 agmatinase [Thermococcus kodakarensis]WCN31179.1 agmatinase [Thermococcus kodakarensis]BAD85071.1 Agmatinase [Thermococcus kodakarensis KOD1]
MEFLYTYETLKLEFPLVEPEKARFILLGVPFDGTTSYKAGARFGPTLIRQATLNLESYILDYDLDIAELPIADIGDIAVVAGDPRKTADRVRETLEELKKANPKAIPILLGGEHSQTLGAVEALKPASYVVFDAHLDLRNSYEDNPYNHACVARRISELGVKEAIFGIRSGTKEEVDFARERDIPWVHARDYSFDAFVDLVEALPEPVYLSIDIDVFDLSMVPSTGTPEAGGLRFWEVVEAIEWLVEKKEIAGFDIMEVAGEKLGDPTALTAAKLLFYSIGAMAKFGR